MKPTTVNFTLARGHWEGLSDHTNYHQVFSQPVQLSNVSLINYLSTSHLQFARPSIDTSVIRTRSLTTSRMAWYYNDSHPCVQWRNANMQLGMRSSASRAQIKVTLKPLRKNNALGMWFNTDVIVTFDISTDVLQAWNRDSHHGFFAFHVPVYALHWFCIKRIWRMCG